MKEFGVDVENNNYKEYVVSRGAGYAGRTYIVEGDWSTASYFCALGALSEEPIICENMNNDSTQGDSYFPKLLEQMGARVVYHENSVEISHQDLVGIESTYTDDSVTIVGGEPHSAAIDTYHDHRIAMSFAIIAARIPMVINDPDVVSKSCSEFWDLVSDLGIKGEVA